MRTIITILAIAPSIATIAQEAGTVAQLAERRVPDTAHVQASRWSGRGGSFPRLGQPIEPMAMRVITWEFGDGSLSHILPPRPWRPSDDAVVRSACMAPFREHNGGSACVSSAESWPCDDRRTEPRPQVISGIDQPVLVTTGLGTRDIRVRMIDPMGRDGMRPVQQRFSSGRWALAGAGDEHHPLFITLQDLSTGECWRAGIDL